jgi:transcriptional regulator with XRE-family HTH domain
MTQAEFAGKLKAARIDALITQRELANRLGITIGCVSRWECGKALPTMAIVQRVAGILGDPGLIDAWRAVR